ncbi:hypothetical protein HAX54_003273, partial [Datura stramonium]|nr:hypothetical protein [Datura stramonium]
MNNPCRDDLYHTLTSLFKCVMTRVLWDGSRHHITQWCMWDNWSPINLHKSSTIPLTHFYLIGVSANIPIDIEFVDKVEVSLACLYENELESSPVNLLPNGW